MADVVKDFNEIYAIARKYQKADILDSAIELVTECKPVFAELKKVCPWPFGKTYIVPCEFVIGVVNLIVDRALSRVEKVIIENRYIWRSVWRIYQADIEATLDSDKLSEIGEIISTYYLYDESKKKFENVMLYLSFKQMELIKLHTALT